jgi:DNA-binding transcriptional LysR family regulator
MPHIRRRITALGALVTFEAAARLGGFTAAAKEMGVTQAAVSRQVSALEDDLGARLFTSAHRRVDLTAAGSALALAVGQSFERIAETVEAIRQPGASATLTVSATLAFSHFWLLPRLSSLLADHPEIKLRVLSQDLPVDLRDGTVDVALRYGTPPYRDGDVAASMSDEIFPVCSPAMLARLDPDRLEPWPAKLPRIDNEASDASWLTWRRWFALTDPDRVPQAGALRFSHYNDAVYAAIDGQGVVLGWRTLLQRPLADGRLVRLGSCSVTPEEAYCVVLPGRSPYRPHVDTFVSWMQALMDPSNNQPTNSPPSPA